MIGFRDPQGSLFLGFNLFGKMVDEKSFYSQLGRAGGRLFADEKFEELYCPDNGRPCVSPSKMFCLLLLQIHDNCSDQEAVDRSYYDLRWKVALDLGLDERLCGRSTLQEFRARLHVSPVAEAMFLAGLDEARRLGLLKGKSLSVAIDTTPVFGRGAVKDTYNLLADGIVKLVAALAELDGVSAQLWAERHDLSRYWGSSIKGGANIDWSDQQAKKAFLNGIVADADRLLIEARDRLKNLDESKAASIKHAARLLMRIITQDTEADKPPKEKTKRISAGKSAEGDSTGPTSAEAGEDPAAQAAAKATSSSEPTTPSGPPSPNLNEPTQPTAGTTPVPTQSVEVPERQDSVLTQSTADATDLETTVVAQAAHDASPADEAVLNELAAWGTENSHHLIGEMIRIREDATKDRVISVTDPEIRHGRKSASKLFYGYKLGISADPISGLILSTALHPGNAPDRQEALELVQDASKNVGIPVRKALADCAYGDGETRQEFKDSGIELSAKVPAPPANDLFHKSRFVLDLTNSIVTCPEAKSTSDYDYTGKRAEGGAVKRFHFPEDVCQACPNKGLCLRSADRKGGRTVTLHLQEELLQQARNHQASPAFKEDSRQRQSVEHRLARLVQLGVRQARYFGIEKTGFQAMMTALVANLGVVASFSLAKRLFWGACPWSRPFPAP